MSGCPCDIICIDGDSGETTFGGWYGRNNDVVMQWYHVQVLRWVLFALENVVAVQGGTKMDFASMCTKLWYIYQWEVNLIKLVTCTGISPREFAEWDAISSFGLHGTTIGTTNGDTSGGAVMDCTFVSCWDKMISCITV